MLASIVASGSAQARGTGSRGDAPSSPVVIEVSRDSFDWQDAGIGAAATLAVVAIGCGVTLIVRARPDLHATTGRR